MARQTTPPLHHTTLTPQSRQGASPHIDEPMTDIQHTDGVCSSLDALLNCPEQDQTATSVMSAIMRADESSASGADQEQLQIALASSLREVLVSRLPSPISPLLSLLPALRVV